MASLGFLPSERQRGSILHSYMPTLSKASDPMAVRISLGFHRSQISELEGKRRGKCKRELGSKSHN